MKNTVCLFVIASLVACSSAKQSPTATSDSPAPSADPGPGDPGTPAPGNVPPDNGNPSVTDAGVDAPAVIDLPSCLSACEHAHPTGKTLGSAIDACWTSKCSPACTDDLVLTDGGDYSPLPDAGACKTDVKTPSPACSDCTVANCCIAWDACFSNADCIALNACSVTCYSTYSK